MAEKRKINKQRRYYRCFSCSSLNLTLLAILVSDITNLCGIEDLEVDGTIFIVEIYSALLDGYHQ